MSKKGVVTVIVTVLVLGAAGAGGWYCWKRFGGPKSTKSEKVFVQKVAAVNTVGGANIFVNSFAGVIVAQKSVDVKYDMNKTVDEILVSEGDHVKKGDKLLTYDVEAIQIDIDTAKLEVERLENQIKTNKDEIAQLEQEKKNADGDAQISYTTRILSMQSENARSEYDIKTKKVEISKLENSLNNAFVTAPIDGTVRSLKDASSLGSQYGSDNPEVIMKIAAEGDFRVKGVFNEQNAGQIYQGAQMVLRSRTDGTERHGVITEIDTSPQTDTNNMYYYSPSDEQTSSSKYAFYVEPDSLDGFMLGQHILIEPDLGEKAKSKTGIWLQQSFVLYDGAQSYVWAKADNDTIEKRIVTVGEVDDEAGDCEILSGLKAEDSIAYPADYIEAGMMTTTNQSDKDIPDNVFNEMEGMNGMNGMDPGMADYGMYGGEEGIYAGDEYGGDGAEGYGDPMMGGEAPEMDENGNITVTDDSGNRYVFDQDGNLIEGPDFAVEQGGMPEGGEEIPGEPAEGGEDGQEQPAEGEPEEPAEEGEPESEEPQEGDA